MRWLAWSAGVLWAGVFLMGLERAGAAEGKSMGLKERSEVPESQRWKLEDLYSDAAAWEADLAVLETEAKAFQACRGKLAKGAQPLKECLDRQVEVFKRLARLSSYASQLHDQDARVTEGQTLKERIQKVQTRVMAGMAFVAPEILAIPKAKLAGFMKSASLKGYRHAIDNLTRRRAHTLGPAEEEIVARTGDMANLPEDVYRTLSTVNVPFPEFTTKGGEKVTLNQAMYTRFRSLPDRAERLRVFREFWGAFRRFRETWAGMLSGAVARDQFVAQVRKYPGCLESALDTSNVPTSIFTTMIEQVRAGRKVLWRYLKLRARLLQISDLGYHDLYASIVPAVELRYSWEETQKLVLAAVAPLGAEAVEVTRRGFTERWADVVPNAGKRSGAYMNGAAYDVHPYVLLNHNDDYESLSTTAHEFGHALHSALANKAQPFVYADYPTFTAEVASTVNENLLRLRLTRDETDPKKKLFLVGQYLDNFRQTVFRQALFSEFEQQIHQRAEKGEALTADVLDALYLKLLKEYYGEAEGVMTIDPMYATEWAYIPHFYYNFYMFQYTTSFVAATAIAARIDAGDAKAREAYLSMLKAGGSLYPVDLLKLGGVDMTSAAPYQEAMRSMEQALDEAEKLIGK